MTVSDLRAYAQARLAPPQDAPENVAPMGRSYIVTAANAGIARVAARREARLAGQANAATASVLFVDEIEPRTFEVVLEDGWIEVSES